ncbi:hypothetical protein JHK86_020002 [Glycine max]|nr:hypothetical protein JHK86_020002 [Glycine max]
MRSGKHSIFLLLSFILFSVLHAPAFAIKKSYIVYMGSHEHGEGVTDADFDLVTQIHHEFVKSYVGRKAKYGEDTIIANFDTGGSPRARVATYKVCWPPIDGNECFDADIMAAFDMAIHDGVDVLSLSLGGNATDYFDDGLSIGAFHANMKGIPVICSAGNYGPTPATVFNVAPWILTVGASTLDRQFDSVVELHNGQRFMGASLSKAMPEDKLYPLINAADAKAANKPVENATLCMRGTIDPEKARGKILVCLRGVTARVEKSLVALEAGAAGMILCNDELSGNELIADPHLLPASQINYKDGLAVYAFMNSTKNPLGYIYPPKTKLQIKPAPAMAAFSSRGPNTVTPEILKPDVIAPGVNIIAAYSEGVSPTNLGFDKRRVPFITMSGTSMSCPHVAGVVGLLKTLHPDWSPAVIKSALMTTARTRDNTGKPMLDGGNDAKATPFAYGSGHIRPNRAMDPGLVYDLTNNDYLNFLCFSIYNQSQIEMFNGARYRCPDIINILDFNYPTITIPKLYGSVSVTRRVKNVGPPGTYTARLKVPARLSISVEPNVLKFDNIGEEKSFKLTVEVTRPGETTAFGGITWSDGKRQVRSPIVVGGDVKKEEGCSSEALGVFDFPWLKDGVTTKPEDYLMDLEDNLSSLLEQEDSSFKAATACIDFSSEAKLEDLAWQPFESDVLELEADDVDYIWSSLLKQPLRPHPAATIFSINIV